MISMQAISKGHGIMHLRLSAFYVLAYDSNLFSLPLNINSLIDIKLHTITVIHVMLMDVNN